MVVGPPAAPDIPTIARLPCRAYEPRFGTADSPVLVPSVDSERIIGCTDPSDDTLVIWGIVREGEPPRQLVEGGEFFVLQRVEKITRVGDLISAKASS